MFNFYMIVEEEDGTKSYWWNVDGQDHLDEALVKNLPEDVVAKHGGLDAGDYLFRYRIVPGSQVSRGFRPNILGVDGRIIQVEGETYAKVEVKRCLTPT